MSNEYFDWSMSIDHPARPIPEPTKQQEATSDVMVLKFIVVLALTGIACGFWMIHQAEKSIACQAVGL